MITFVFHIQMANPWALSSAQVREDLDIECHPIIQKGHLMSILPKSYLFALLILYVYFHDVTGNGEGDVQREVSVELD